MRHFNHHLLEAATPAQNLVWLFCTDTCSGIGQDNVLHFVSKMLTAEEVTTFGMNTKLIAKKHGWAIVSGLELATGVAKLFACYWMENGAIVFPD